MRARVDSGVYHALNAVINGTEAWVPGVARTGARGVFEQKSPPSAPYGFDTFEYQSASGLSLAAKIDGRLCDGKTYGTMVGDLVGKIESQYGISKYGISALHPDCLKWPEMKRFPPKKEIVGIPDVIDSRDRCRDRTTKKRESQTAHLDKNGLAWLNDDAALVAMHLSYRLKNGFPLRIDGKTIMVEAIGTRHDKGNLLGGQITRTGSGRSLQLFFFGLRDIRRWPAGRHRSVSAAGAPKS